jgi:subtilisin family serine protease
MNGRQKTWSAAFWTGAAVLALAAQAGAAGGAARAKRLIVSFKPGTTAAQREAAAKAMGLTINADLGDIDVAVLEKSSAFSPEDVVRAESIPDVLVVEQDVYRNWLLEGPASFQAAPLPGADETWRSLAPALERSRAEPADGDGSADASKNVPWGVARVDAPAAWSSGQGAGVKVAVIDTGIDCTHPDLQCDFSAGTNIANPGAEPMDDNEHGTHVSGTIAGRGASGGVLGVAPKAVLIPVKVLDADGAGSLSDIVKGISWATEAGVDVINMSLGGETGSPALAKAVKNAAAKGIVVVCAAGNSGPDPDTVGFPAGYPGAIAVAASDPQDNVAGFSSRGAKVAFIAPGVDVESTVPGGGYKKLSGTSMASPHVAGLAALAIERGARGPSGVRAAFKAAASKLCSSGCLPPTEEGAGLIDAAKLR